MAMTEETLVQEVTAEYLLNELQWNESFIRHSAANLGINYLIESTE